MYSKVLRIATRNSRLAICQAQYVYNELKCYYPNVMMQLMPILTTGDKILKNISFYDFCHHQNFKKGVFIKELEYALIKHQADIAVHSMKDVTGSIPDELVIPVICKRDDPRDAFVSLKYSDMNKLPIGSIIGTSSLRRQCQIREYRSDLIINDLRGNVDTRLKKLHCGAYDAIILAVAGLHRLKLHGYIRSRFNPALMLPAMGQGAIAIECRSDDINALSLLSPLYHQETTLCISAERAVTTYLSEHCRFPIASYAKIVKNRIWLRALLGLPDGSKVIRVEGFGLLDQSEILGRKLAEDLLTQFNKQVPNE